MAKGIKLSEIREFGNIELLARQLVDGFITGLHKSPYHGFSVEFAEHRLYNTGESTRHIDWKVFARTDRLYTKVYEEETNLRCRLVIDNSSSMYYPQENNGKITFSILAAAALAYLLQKQRDAVGLCAFSETIEQQTQVKSTSSHLHKLFLLLTDLLKERPQMKKPRWRLCSIRWLNKYTNVRWLSSLAICLKTRRNQSKCLPLCSI